jgi:hypothetical protein
VSIHHEYFNRGVENVKLAKKYRKLLLDMVPNPENNSTVYPANQR